MVIFYDIADFTKQPLSIYPKTFQLVLRNVIPFAFTSYFPSAYLLGLYDPLTITIQAVGVALIRMFIAYRFWKFCLKIYESAGN
jgi:ABC-2 type transport system permease protein